MKFGNRLVFDSALAQFRLDVVQTDFFEFVYRNGYVNHLVGMSHYFGDAVQDFTIVHFQRYANSEFAEYLPDDSDEFDLVEQRARTYDIYVALVKLAITSLLRTVGAPNGLYLVTLERECDFVLMLHDIAGERHGQVVAQSLFADFRCGTQCLAVEP